MTEIVNFRVKKEIKEKMNFYKEKINWNEELRNFIIKKIEQFEKERIIDEIGNLLKKTKNLNKGIAEMLVREDRDSH